MPNPFRPIVESYGGRHNTPDLETILSAMGGAQDTGNTPPPPPVVVPPAPTPVGNIAKLGQIGFNVGDDWGQSNSTFMFLDRMKSAGFNGQWSTADGQPPAPTDSYGYLTGMGGQPERNTFVGLRRPDAGEPAIRHVLRHNGVGLNWTWEGTSGITIVDASDPNRVIFDVGPLTVGGVPQLRVTGATSFPTYKPGNPQATRDGIAIYELAHEPAYLAGEIIHPAWAEAHKNTFRLRFMDAFKINHSPVVGVADRTLVGSMSYNSNAPYGMPIEVIVASCNKVGANLHLCVPHAANDAYLAYVFGYVRDNLDAALTLDLEYSNEVWNFSFNTQFNYAANKAQELTGTANNAYGYGYLAAQLVKKARDIFGAQASRVRGLFARQYGSMDSLNAAVPGVEAFEGKKLKDYFAEVSVGFYLSGGGQVMADPTGTPEQRQALMAEVALYEATGSSYATRTVRQQLVDQMRTGNAIAGWPNVNTLAQLGPDLQNVADFARLHGIPQLTGYEGQNFHVNANGPLGGTDATRVVTMYRALANDPRVSGTQPGSLMRDQYTLMRGIGMTAQTIFMDFYPEGLEFGDWGSKRSAVAPDTGKWLFYRWYQDNYPDQVLFEVNGGGALTFAKDEPTERVFAAYGGLVPSSPVTLKSGTLPAGMTFVNGRLSGTPTEVGTHALVFAGTDASGREVTKALTYTVAQATNFRYFRLTPKANRNGGVAGETFTRFGTAEVAFKNGATTIAPTGWAATAPGSAFRDNVPGRAVDGAILGSFITEAGQGPGILLIDTQPGDGFKPTSLDIYDCNEESSFSFDGVLVEVSRNGTTWITVANVAAGAMPYTGRVANVPLAYPA